MKHATYVGENPVLMGKTALVQINDGQLTAQFDDRDCEEYVHDILVQYAYNWHPFPVNDFVLDSED